MFGYLLAVGIYCKSIHTLIRLFIKLQL